MSNTKGKALLTDFKQKVETVLDKGQLKAVSLRYAFCTVVSFLFTRLLLLGRMNGFGFAFAAALPLPYGIGGWIGCLLGEMFEGFDAGTVFYIAVLGGWMLLKRYLKAQRRLGIFWQTALLGAVLLLKIAVAYFALDLPLFDFAMQFLGAVLQLVLFIASSVFSSAFTVGKPLSEYSRAQTLAALLLCVTLIASLGRYRFLGITLAGVAAVMAVTVAAHRFGCVGGAAAGVLAGMGVLLSDLTQIEFVGIMMFGGFLSGLAAKRSKLLAAVSMMVIHYLLVLVYGKPLQMMPLTMATMIGVIAFLAVPLGMLEAVVLPDAYTAELFPKQRSAELEKLQRYQQMRMAFAADTVCMLGVSVSELADVLKKEVRPDMEQVCNAVEQKLCKTCRRRFYCFGEDFDRVKESFYAIGSVLQSGGQIGTDSFPQFLKENCILPNELILTYTAAYARTDLVSQKQRQLDRCRALVLEQYGAMEELLRELGEGEGLQPDVMTEQHLSEWLSKEGYAPKQLSCGKNAEDRMFIDLYYAGDLPSERELSELLQKGLKRSFDKPVICDGKTLTRMTFSEPAAYGVQLAVSQKASAKSKHNGDTVVSFYDGRGHFYLLLSDGMGRGKRAALDSMTVCTILSKLLTAGFGVQASLKLLNTTLVIKSTEESLATVDIIRVDLHSGEAMFFKAGAASSYWANEKSVSRIRSFTLPLGIVEGIRFDSKKVAAKEGDILLLCSDGIAAEDESIAKTLFQCRDKPLKQLTDRLCADSAQEQDPDDKTVAAIRILRYQKETDTA